MVAKKYYYTVTVVESGFGEEFEVSNNAEEVIAYCGDLKDAKDIIIDDAKYNGIEKYTINWNC